jgi:hypothetical protein
MIIQHVPKYTSQRMHGVSKVPVTQPESYHSDGNATIFIRGRESHSGDTAGRQVRQGAILSEFSCPENLSFQDVLLVSILASRK